MEDIIPKLKFIGKIQKGDKVNVKHMYIQPMNIVSRISRSFFNIDDRANTLIFIATTIKNAFDLLLQHLENNKQFDIITAQNIVLDLRSSRNGLLNLKETYNDDVMFCCKIDALIQDTDAKLIELENKYEYLKQKDTFK